MARNAPASEEYHHAAALIFALHDEHPASTELIHETYIEYLKLAKPTVRFSVTQLITLIRRLARNGYAADAEKLTQVLGRRAPQEQQLPDLLLLVAEGFRSANNQAMCAATLKRLLAEFPGSEAARNAALINR